MKTIICLFLSIVLLFSFCALPVSSEEKDVSFPLVSGASKVIMYHIESDRVVYKINSTENDRIAPASTVKIMTGLLAIDELGSRLDEKITVSSDMLKGTAGVKVGLSAGDTLTLKDLLYCLICGGGNDAAYVVANICSGSVDSFVKKMNEKAKSMGLTNTHYKNPTGIDDPDMYTTLEDTLELSKIAAKNELYVKCSSAKNYSFSFVNNGETKTVSNRNAQISAYTASGYVNKNVKGLNAGMTDNGGYCISSYATNGTDSYICVVMGGGTNTSGRIASYAISNTLINHAFDHYTYTIIASKGDKLGKITVENALPINGNQAVTVDCVLEDDLYGYVPEAIDYKTDLEYKVYYHTDSLSAPVSTGLIAGGVDVYYNGKFITSGRLLTNESIVESDLLVTLEAMRNAILSRTTLIFVILLIVFIAIYYLVLLLRKRKRERTYADSIPNLYRKR